jgi:hypothetical protein
LKRKLHHGIYWRRIKKLIWTTTKPRKHRETMHKRQNKYISIEEENEMKAQNKILMNGTQGRCKKLIQLPEENQLHIIERNNLSCE